jgi:hypothetical protein
VVRDKEILGHTAFDGCIHVFYLDLVVAQGMLVDLVAEFCGKV